MKHLLKFMRKHLINSNLTNNLKTFKYIKL